jgi:cytochrome c
MVADLPAPYNTGDPENGKRKFGLCRSCHSIAKDGPNMTGPHLYGVFDRKAAAVEGYNYSDALKTAGGEWTPERLDHWLANPRTALPGTKMTFAGIKDAKDRIDVIAYLRTQADS